MIQTREHDSRALIIYGSQLGQYHGYFHAVTSKPHYVKELMALTGGKASVELVEYYTGSWGVQHYWNVQIPRLYLYQVTRQGSWCHAQPG